MRRQMLMGPDASPEAVAALATKLGLARPALQRYGDWIGGLLMGSMAESYAYSTPVLDLVLERLALTIPLALLAMVITAVLALARGRVCRIAPQPLGGCGRDGPGADRHCHPQLLVCDFADPAVFGEAAMVFRRWLSGLDASQWRQPAGGTQGPAAAGHCPGGRAGGHLGAHHALCRAGSAA